MLANTIPAAVGLNSCVMAKLYTTCIHPKRVTYPGHAQNLPYLTRSDMLTGLYGFTCMQALIYLLKLLLCKLRPDELANKLFIHLFFEVKMACTYN